MIHYRNNIPMKLIRSTLPRSNFSESDLEKAAQLILEIGGLISPLILFEEKGLLYTVIEGDFKYYAAVRANKRGINAIIIESKTELSICQQQIEVFAANAKIQKTQ